MREGVSGEEACDLRAAAGDFDMAAHARQAQTEEECVNENATSALFIFASFINHSPLECLLGLSGVGGIDTWFGHCIIQ